MNKNTAAKKTSTMRTGEGARNDDMTTVISAPETDVRERILVTAERLFREIGYQKTTVADIAKILNMSPANVYRFFDSKKSIHEGVARRLMGEVEAAARTILASRKPAPVRLRELLITVHHMNAERYVQDAKIHDMVAVAMEESWDVCEAHLMQLTEALAQVIAEGMAAGEFRQMNVELAAGCVWASMARFFHPQLIAQCAALPGPSIEEMADFMIDALRGKAAVS